MTVPRATTVLSVLSAVGWVAAGAALAVSDGFARQVALAPGWVCVVAAVTLVGPAVPAVLAGRGGPGRAGRAGQPSRRAAVM